MVFFPVVMQKYRQYFEIVIIKNLGGIHVLTVNPYEKYKQNNVLTASPGELIVMLFEGCLRFLRLAHKALVEKDFENSNTNLIKAQNIILELMSSLNFEYEISNSLYSSYNYIFRELIEINIKKDAQRLKPIIEMVDGYHKTWQEAVKKDRMNKYNFDNRGYA